MHGRLALLLALLLAGCPTEQEEPLPDPDPPGIDLVEDLDEDEARAGVLAEDDIGAFIGGAAAESQAGDILLYNDRARFVVRGLRQGHFYAGTAGSVIDMDIVRPPGQADRDGMDDYFTMTGLAWIFDAETIEVLADGLDGGPAVVQATGTDVTFTYLEGAMEAPGLFPPRGLEMTQTYTLHPGAPVLELVTDVVNPTDDDLTLPMIDAGIIDLATFTQFVPGAGFDGDPPEGGREMMVMVSHRNDLTVATFRPDEDLDEGALSAISDEFDLVASEGPTWELGPGEAASYTRLLGVAADQAALETWRRAVRGLPSAGVDGVVTVEGSGEPVAGARAFLTDLDGNPRVLAITDEDGAFHIDAEPGDYQVVVLGDANNEQMDFPAGTGAYGLYAHSSTNEAALLAFNDDGSATPTPRADGHGRSVPVAVTLAEAAVADVAITLPPPAILRVRVEDGDGQLIPALVHLMFPDGVSDPAPEDRRLGEHRPRGGARKTVWVLDGEMDVPVVAGTYDLVAHRGFRYELGEAAGVALTAGETVEQTLVLVEAYETPGWISGDLHTHASPSIDGELLIEERLATAVCGDVQVHVATDHDHVADYRPAAAAMDIDRWTLTVPGDEISPTIRGHFNVYPVEPDSDEPNGGTPRWWEMQVTTSELFAAWRERIGDQAILQVNHGRDNGMFQWGDFDPISGTAGDPDFYCDGFDTVEILNSNDFDYTDPLREDWRAHLDLGLRPTAVGVSDSHGRLPGAGNARTYVQVGVDDLADLDTDVFFEMLKEQRAIVSGGPFITLEATDGIDTAGIGETLEAAEVTLHVQVLAPSWMPVDEVRIYTSGGVVLATEIVDHGTAEPPLWFDGELVVAPGDDAWYVAEVVGSADMGPVWSGMRAYALTNPVYVDVP
jgi:hypothetical protein